MKKITTSFWAVVALAAAFTACSKDDAEAPVQTPREKTMTVVASSELKIDKDSRTVLDPATNAVSWSTSGEYIKVFETVGATTTPATSAEGVITEGKAAFGVSFTENTTAASFTYNAVYPASAWVDASDNKAVDKLKVITPTAQQPTATSFDAAADLLIALPQTSATQPDQLSIRLARMVAIGKMTISNLNSTEAITAIKFTAPGKSVTGRSYANLTAGTMEYGYTGNSNENVELNYASSLDLKSGMTAYFACFPFALTAGEKFTVTVTTPSKIFTREVTLGEGRSLEFIAGQSSTFTVNMATATEAVNDKLPDGNYAIIALQNSIYYAMSATAQSSRLAQKTIDFDSSSEYYSTDDNTIIWTIASSGDNYTIANGTKYLSWQGGSTNGATISENEYALSITKNENNTYAIASVATPARILAKNLSAEYGFGFYGGSQTKDLLLVKVGADTRVQLSAPTNLEAIAVGNEVVATWTTVEGAADYTVTCGEESQTVTQTEATFTMAYSTEYTISVVANPTDATVNTPSEAATTTVTTEANPNPVAEFDMTDNANFNTTSDLVGEFAYFYDNTLTPNIGLVFGKGTGTKEPYYYYNSTQSKRNHQLNTGNTLTIEGKTITKVEFTTTSGYEGGLTADAGSYNSLVWTGNASKVIFTATSDARITNIVVTYDKESQAVFTPAILSVDPDIESFAASDYTPQTVTVTAMNADGLTLTANALTAFNATIEGMRVTVEPKAVNSTDAAIEETLTLTLGTATYDLPLKQLAAGVTEVTYTLDFIDKTNQDKIGSYTATWNKTIGDNSWSITGFNNNNNGWDYIKCGRKGNASTANITTKWAIPEALNKVVVTVDAYTTVNGCTSELQVATDINFTQNLQTVSGTVAKGDITYTIPNPTGNCYYKLVYNCPSGSANGYIQISKVIYTTD